MPVRVVKANDNDPRTLWVMSPNMGGYKAYESLFYGAVPYVPDCIIRPRDVVFFDGGTDVNPQWYGESKHIATEASDVTRDQRERKAFARAQAAGARCLGTCRGAQLLCVLSGGKLVQHVTGHYHGGHMIVVEDGSCIYTESSHHQVMWPEEIPHVLIAWADTKAQQPFIVNDEYGKDFPDGRFPEIIYCKNTKSLCIQGHSEWVAADSEFRKLTHKLVQEFLLSE